MNLAAENQNEDATLNEKEIYVLANVAEINLERQLVKSF